MSVVLATAGFDHKIRFWEAPSGVCTRIIKYPDSQVNRLEITPDKQCKYRGVGVTLRCVAALSLSLALTPSSPLFPTFTVIAAAGNPVIRLYEILAPASKDPMAQQSQQAVLTLEGHTGSVTSLGFQKDGRYLYSAAEDGTVKVWDLRSPNFSRSFDCGAAVNSVTLRTDRDEFVSGDQNGCVKIWDLGGNGCINSIKPSAAADSAASMSAAPNQYNSRRSRNSYSGTVPIQAVDISEDSRTLVAVSNHGTVYVWDPSSTTGAAALSSNSVGDNPETDDPAAQVTDTDATTQNLLRPVTKFRAHAAGYYSLYAKMSPDNRTLVTTGSDGLAKLWDTTTWDLTQTLQNEKWVWDAAFCADSSYLVTASSDHVARLWNLRTGDVVRQYHGHQSAVTCVALNDSSV
jgi:G protein beta subunit-like protein